jgi:hypothetical protein
LEKKPSILTDWVALFDVEAVLVGAASVRETSLIVERFLDLAANSGQRQLRKLVFKTEVIREENVPFPFPGAHFGRRNPGTDRRTGPQKEGMRRVSIDTNRSYEGIQG